MPKLKTHKGAQNRFYITGNGKIMRSKIGKSHLRRAKSAQTKRAYHKKFQISPRDYTRIKSVLPYGV